MMQENIRFGVLGTGRITRRIVAELQQTDGVSVAGIASRDSARARWYADQFGIPHAFGSYRGIVESDQIDAVYIALPPAMHTTWALAAAEAGKHVLCEKPLATTLAETLQIDARCAQAHVRWMDATGWLHHRRTGRMRQLVASGELGRLRHISAAVSFFEPFQSADHRLEAELGGGCLLDLGWYACGIAVWAAGGAPERIFAAGTRRGDIWNRVSGLGVFAGDLSATINCGYDTATRKWAEIAGDNASLVCDDFTRPWVDRPARFWVHDRAGAVRSESFEGNQEKQMIAAFVAEIRSGGDDLAPLRRQAIETARMLEAVALSLSEQTEISLAELGSLSNADA